MKSKTKSYLQNSLLNILSTGRSSSSSSPSSPRFIAMPKSPSTPNSPYAIYRSMRIPTQPESILGGGDGGDGGISKSGISNITSAASGKDDDITESVTKRALCIPKYISFFDDANSNMRIQLKNIESISNIWDRLLQTLREMRIAFKERRSEGIINFRSFHDGYCISMEIRILDCEQNNYLFQFSRIRGDQTMSFRLYYEVVNNSDILKDPLVVPRILRKGKSPHRCDEHKQLEESCIVFVENSLKLDLRFIEDKIFWARDLARKTKCSMFLKTHGEIFSDIISEMENIFADTNNLAKTEHEYITIFGCLSESLTNMIKNGYSDIEQIDSYQKLLQKALDESVNGSNGTSGNVMRFICQDSLDIICNNDK